ncbi:MAG: hypothetical protein AAF770_02795 [Bacteroidota bacterium]
MNLKNNKKVLISILSLQGKVAFMLLKSYSQSSGKRLIEQVNGNIYYQFFCGTRISAGEQLKNNKIVSQARRALAETTNIEK